MKNAQKISILGILEDSSFPISTGRLHQVLLDTGEEIERPALFVFLQNLEKKGIVSHDWEAEGEDGGGTIVFTWKLLTPLVGNLNDL